MVRLPPWTQMHMRVIPTIGFQQRRVPRQPQAHSTPLFFGIIVLFTHLYLFPVVLPLAPYRLLLLFQISMCHVFLFLVIIFHLIRLLLLLRYLLVSPSLSFLPHFDNYLCLFLLNFLISLLLFFVIFLHSHIILQFISLTFIRNPLLRHLLSLCAHLHPAILIFSVGP